MFNLFRTQTQEELYPDVRLYNTETRSIETFEPLSKKEVTLYSCGPTVYDYAHIGNLRAYVFADTLKRTLLYNGYTVNHTLNFTDFGHLTSDADTGEDKMMKGLKREGMDINLASMRALSDRYIDAFKNDIEALNILPPTQFARASDYVKDQIRLIETLEEKGYTYETSDGVYFDITKFATYGRLGNINVEEMRAGARVEVNSQKRNEADFAVWKKGELGWDSRWGKGFPGWHIECSAMAFATLGKQIDIHTGGIDHIHTHHNAEIAQSESATGKQFVKYWMHVEFVTIHNARIGKSEGNMITLPDLIEQGFSAEDYRYWLLTSHYRSNVNFSTDALSGAQQALQRLKHYMYEQWSKEKGRVNTMYQQRFVEAINDDLDTPKAIAIMWEAVKDDTLSAGDKYATLYEFDTVLGIGLSKDPEEGVRELGYLSNSEVPEDIQDMLQQREAARVAHNWAEADRLRDALALKGYVIEDTSQGPKVSKSS